MAVTGTKYINFTLGKTRYPWETDDHWSRYVYLKNGQGPHDGVKCYITDYERTVLLVIRIITIKFLGLLLGLHVKSVRMFVWEQTITAGILITYMLAIVGLALGIGSGRCESKFLQAYILCTGAILLATNSFGISWRWRGSELAANMIQILVALGIPIRRYIALKACLSAAAALCMVIDLILVGIFTHSKTHDSD